MFRAAGRWRSFFLFRPTRMFKKKKSVKAKSFKKRTLVDDDEEEVDESVTDTVKAIKRRREVLNGLQYKRGVDAAALGSRDTTTKKIVATMEEEEEEDSKLPSNTKMTNESQVWKERHEKAMEEYIESQLQQQQKDSNTFKDGDHQQSTASIHSKDQLFQELAVTAQQLSGKTTNDETTTLQHQEVLRSGAATAMAEVILPSSATNPSKSTRTKSQAVVATTESPLDGRVGFAAARGLKESKPREPSADEKAYKNFVQRQRR